MSWVYIEDLGGHLGEEVTLKGWLYNRRSSGKVHFLLIRDGTGVCQCVASIDDLGAEAFAAADHLGQETSLEVTGVVREDKRAPGGRELTITRLEVLRAVDRLSDHAQGTRRRISARSAPSVGALGASACDPARCAARSRRPAATFSTSADSCCSIRRS